MSESDDELHFIAALGNDGRAHCLVRVHTPLGAPHLACAGERLARRYIELMGVAGRAAPVAGSAIDASVHFDVERFGVLVFDDDAALDAYVLDADEFDYGARIRRPRLGVTSNDPW